jgi:peptidoglycan hydrolase CwlO-like protein
MLTRNRHHLLRALAVLLTLGALLASSLVSTSAGDLQSEINAGRSAAESLRGQIAQQTASIEQTAGGIASAQNRLSGLQSQLDLRVAELRSVQNALVTARDHLMALENRLRTATRALSANLVTTYEGGQPNLMTVILSAHGFSQLLNEINFLSRIGHQDAGIVQSTRAARAEVQAEAERLAGLETRDRTLTDQVLAQRNQVAALHAALIQRQIGLLGHRSSVRTKLASLDNRLGKLEAKAAAQARAAAIAAARANAANAATQNGAALSADGTASNGLAIDSGGMVQAPAGAPAAVREVIAGGNAIATLPYIWGGGHGSFQSPGYDCSGSVSYALAAAGLLSSPLDSTGFESYGDPGPGRWITIYANADHAWMVVAGWRFDTVAQAETGTRWAQGGGEFAGMVVRHPPGL